MMRTSSSATSTRCASAQMVAAVASTFEPYAFAGLAGETLEHAGADALIA
jgi:hypothetical protein